MRKFRESALRVTPAGTRSASAPSSATRCIEVIEPIVYDEALDLIREHQAAGRRVFIISASPEEIVEPLGRVPRRRRGDRQPGPSSTTRVATPATSSSTPTARSRPKPCSRWPSGKGIDLDASYAYSDSVTDLPMLEAVGQPVAVNPDRDLARVAQDRDWEVRLFRIGVPLRERVPMPPPRLAAAVATTAAIGRGAGAGAVWWWC